MITFTRSIQIVRYPVPNEHTRLYVHIRKKNSNCLNPCAERMDSIGRSHLQQAFKLYEPTKEAVDDKSHAH